MRSRLFLLPVCLLLVLLFCPFLEAEETTEEPKAEPKTEPNDEPKAKRSLAELLSEGIRLYTNRSYGKALGYFNRVLKAEPGHAKARYYRGILHVVKLRYPEALADFDVTYKAWPDSLPVLVQRGRALLALNRFPEAVTDLARAKKLVPKGRPAPSHLDVDLRQAKALAKADKTAGVGQEAPAIRLMGASGKVFDLSALRGGNYVVLVFYVTWASPECRDQLSQYNEFQEDLGRRGAVAVTISTDRLKFGIELRENKEFTVRILSDEKGAVTKAYGLVNLRSKATPRSLPAVLVVDRKGLVAWRKVSYDPRDRIGPEKILKVLEGLIEKDKAKDKERQDRKPG